MVVDDVCCGTVTPSASATFGVTTKWRHRKAGICPFCLVLDIVASSLRGWTFQTNYRTNASEFERMHLLAVLSSGGTGERMLTLILSLRLCRPCHPSKRRCERWHVLGLLDSP